MKAQEHIPNLKARELWKELAEKSLKGQDLERVLNTSTFEGVDFKGLYDQNKRLLELYSFPETFLPSTIYDSGLAKAQDIAEDQMEGIQSSFMVVRQKKWQKDFPKSLNLSFLLQRTGEETIADFAGKNAFVDCNRLNFDAFEADVKRVAASGLGFVINMSQIHNAGASVVQELSFGLNVFSTLLSLGVDEKKIVFLSAADSLFFMNIAKLRALRYLAEEVMDAHGKKPNPYILSVSSLREQTLYDPWVNMLRNCASSMAGVLGGANEVAIRPHDAAFSLLTEEPSNHKARRSARHILNIVNEESNLSFVSDAAKGSFAIEELTSGLVSQAWESFLNWEENGLYLNIKDFAKSVEAIAKARYEKTRKRKVLITGVNDFANAEETLEALYEKSWRPVDLTTGLFPLRRSALEFEELRIAVEKTEIKLKAALVYKGKLSALSARINFVKNLLETLGLEILDIEAGEDVEESFREAKKNDCNILLLVGKDEEYSSWAKDAGQVFIGKFVAGNKENFEFSGKENYTDLYMGKNIFQDLKRMLEKAGVEL